MYRDCIVYILMDEFLCIAKEYQANTRVRDRVDGQRRREGGKEEGGRKGRRKEGKEEGRKEEGKGKVNLLSCHFLTFLYEHNK
jgi:hypothetical protein